MPDKTRANNPSNEHEPIRRFGRRTDGLSGHDRIKSSKTLNDVYLDKSKKNRLRNIGITAVAVALIAFIILVAVKCSGSQTDPVEQVVPETPSLVIPEQVSWGSTWFLRTAAENDPTDYVKLAQTANEYPTQLLFLALRNPDTISFVMDYPNRPETTLPYDEDVDEGEFPDLRQWDSRWGFGIYAGDYIALNGCGPTCLSVVYMGLFGSNSMDPGQMCSYSARNGYGTLEAGTDWTLMSTGANNLSIHFDNPDWSVDAVKAELEKGRPIIMSMNPGTFTTSGHFIVLTGLADDGKIKIVDPNSDTRSAQTWDCQALLDECANLWSYWV